MQDESAALDLVNVRKLLADLRAIDEFKPLKSKQRRFIFAYAGTGRITSAAELSKVPWLTHYKWMKQLKEYRDAFEKAKEMFADYAEGEIFQRAFFGELHTITKGRGENVRTEKFMQKSDILAMFALKGLRPQYRDNWQVNTFVGPASLNIGYSSAAPAIDVTPAKGNDSE